MKRRDFLKSAAMATAAGAALPLSSTGSECPPASDVYRTSGALHERYNDTSRVRSGIALGGIGTGGMELRKDGRFYNWSIFNNFPKETGPVFTLPEGGDEDPMASNLFFKVRYQVEGEGPRMKLLALNNGLGEGAQISIAYMFPWMDAIEQIDCAARYPFTRLAFSDPEMPFDIVMHAWSPFIPHDVKNSALPLAFFDFDIVSKSTKRVDVNLMMAARNNVGYDAPERSFITEIFSFDKYKTVSMSCGGMGENASTFGQIAIASFAPGSTHYTGWSHLHPYYQQVLRNSELPNLDDTDGVESIRGDIPAWMPRTSGRNRIDQSTGKKQSSAGHSGVFCTIAKSFVLSPASKQAKHSFVYAWNFPNLYAETEFRKPTTRNEGHYYSNFFNNAREVADYAFAERKQLAERTHQFQTNFFDSSADVELLEQVNSHLNTFATSGRLVKGGDFGVLEGMAATWSWGPAATIDVMLYGTAPIIALFPELQKATMRAHARAQLKTGEVNHGLQKNFEIGEDQTVGVYHRLDLAGQFVIMALRDFFWSNDREFLRDLYPHVKLAIEYTIGHRCFAGDQIPIQRGIETSYDNFPMYGYSTYVVSQWLCAVASAAVAAEAMGDREAAARYHAIAERARQRMEEKLWNGSYYRLYNDTDGAGKKGGVSEACLTDQIVGQWNAHHCALGHLLDPQHTAAALRSILKANYRRKFGLKNCSWPGDGEISPIDKDIWVDQGNTCWSGVELAFASFLLYEGMYREALDLVHTVDRRYRKNGLYWNHQEFGGHYFRCMSSWAILNGLLGLGLNQDRLRFDPQLRQPSFKLFFATPIGTAHFIRTPEKTTLRCLTGKLNIRQLEIEGGNRSYAGQLALNGQDVQTLARTASKQTGGFVVITPREPITLEAGHELTIA